MTHTELAAQRAAFEAAMVARGYERPQRGLHPDSQYLYTEDQDRFIGFCAALESTERLAGGGEPVAFIQRQRSSTDGGIDEELVWHKDEELEGVLYEYQPLYPAPHTQAQRVPLSDGEIEALDLDDATFELLSDLVGVDVHDVNLRDHPTAWSFVGEFSEKVARAIERAHGITPKEGT